MFFKEPYAARLHSEQIDRETDGQPVIKSEFINTLKQCWKGKSMSNGYKVISLTKKTADHNRINAKFV